MNPSENWLVRTILAERPNCDTPGCDLPAVAVAGERTECWACRDVRLKHDLPAVPPSMMEEGIPANRGPMRPRRIR